MAIIKLRRAAALLGVSDDTLRRWAENGRIELLEDADGHQAVDGLQLAELWAAESAGMADLSHAPIAESSIRNRFTGIVTNVIKDKVMAQVEIQSGPNHLVSLISRQAADEMKLEPGVIAVASVKATNLSVDLPQTKR